MVTEMGKKKELLTNVPSCLVKALKYYRAAQIGSTLPFGMNYKP